MVHLIIVSHGGGPSRGRRDWFVQLNPTMQCVEARSLAKLLHVGSSYIIRVDLENTTNECYKRLNQQIMSGGSNKSFHVHQ